MVIEITSNVATAGFSIGRLAEGPYMLRAHKPGCHPAQSNVVFAKAGLVADCRMPLEVIEEDGVRMGDLRKSNKWQRVNIKPEYAQSRVQ